MNHTGQPETILPDWRDGRIRELEQQLAEARAARSATGRIVTEEMVNSFLSWPLPKSVSADGCATNPNYPHTRCGTNLLTADEARQMLEHVLERRVRNGFRNPERRDVAPSSTERNDVIDECIAALDREGVASVINCHGPAKTVREILQELRGASTDGGTHG